MHPYDEYLKAAGENNLRRKEGYFTRYINFKSTAATKGISESEIPLLWIAYHLNELENMMSE
jgi:hypothetical protein